MEWVVALAVANHSINPIGKVYFRPRTDVDSTYCGGLQQVNPQPASHTHFNQHPQRYCRTHHPQYIGYVPGCNIHRGVLLGNRCMPCEEEIITGRYVEVWPLQSTIGYPGDEAM